MTEYVELHARSAFSFLEGASLPEDLATAAAGLDQSALAILDCNNIAGAVRFHKTALQSGIKAHMGAEIVLEGGGRLPLIVENAAGYRNLCRLITRIKMRDGKEDAAATDYDLEEYAEGLICLTGDENGPLAAALKEGHDQARSRLDRLIGIFGQRQVYAETQRHFERVEEERNQFIRRIAETAGIPTIATNGARFATPASRELYDVMTCARHRTTISRAGRLLSTNSSRHLLKSSQMSRLFCDDPAAVARTLEVSDRISFTLTDLGYKFPEFRTPPGEDMNSFLRRQTEAGAIRRYGHYSGRVRQQIEKELDLIARLGLSGYFLIVWELVCFCREQGILAQGRGSAANSAVCYSLGITAVDPIAMDLLFERFLSEERGEWPDIDLDLPSGDKRESVIQHVYQRYGTRGSAMTAVAITYRGRSAVRDIGKALELPEEKLDKMSRLIPSFGAAGDNDSLNKRFVEAGFDINDPAIRRFMRLIGEIQDLPRHLGQHPGGMIICEGLLDEIVPLEPASMPGRVIAQWDKDDCAAMGIIKIDLLGLGMLAAIEECLILIPEHYGETVDLAHLPADDPAVYDTLHKADTVGWFQVESRAQMSCLPRTRPVRFYDLVVQVAIIRPGPIVGQMASPYIKRRQGLEPVTYWHPMLEPALARTLGVPLFQEQLMRIAIIVAGFSAGEAEELRRTLGSRRSRKAMEAVEKKLRHGMAERGIAAEMHDTIVRSITSFAQYGFPESHAASFALIAYASGYLKCHYLAAYVTALLNCQPMGFYSPATLVKDAQRHGQRFLPTHINESEWKCTLERKEEKLVVRLGFNYIAGLRRETARLLIEERECRGPYESIGELKMRVPQLNRRELRRLSEAGALNDLPAGASDHRRAALWESELALRPVGPLLRMIEERPIPSPLVPMTEFERLNADLNIAGLSIGRHPVAFFREPLTKQGVYRASELLNLRNGLLVEVAGLVICRQRPQTANGLLFMSLEDESGISNIVVMPDIWEKQRATIVGSHLIRVIGVLQNLEGSASIKAYSIRPLPVDLAAHYSHDFH